MKIPYWNFLRYFTADYSDKAPVLSRCPLSQPSDWLLTPVFCDEAGISAISHKEQVHSVVDHMCCEVRYLLSLIVGAGRTLQGSSWDLFGWTAGSGPSTVHKRSPSVGQLLSWSWRALFQMPLTSPWGSQAISCEHRRPLVQDRNWSPH